MKQSFESKSYGSIRKYKAYGTCGVVLGMAALALSNGAVVSADELAPVSGQVVVEIKVVNDTPTGNPAANLAEAAKPASEPQKALESNEGTVSGSQPVTVDHSALTEAAKGASDVGVNVVQDKTSVAPTTSTAEDTEKSVKSISAEEAKKTSELKSVTAEHSNTMSTWVKNRDSVVAFNEGLDNAHKSAVSSYTEFIKTFDEDKAAVVAQYKDAIIKVTEQVQKSSNGETVEGYQAYIRELAEQQALNKQAIQEYLSKKAFYEDQSMAASRTISENISNSQRIESENSAQSTAASNETARRSLSASTENSRLSLSASVVDKANYDGSVSASNETKKRSLSASEVNRNLSLSASTVDSENVKGSNSAKEETARRSTSASNENKRLSLSASTVDSENTKGINSAKAETNRRSTSASEENKRLSLSASAVVLDNTTRSNAAKAETARRSTSAAEANRSLSLSASQVLKDNTAKSLSVDKHNADANAYNSQLMGERGLTWTGNWLTDTKTVEDYNRDVARRTTVTETFDKKLVDKFEEVSNANHDRNAPLPAAANGYTPSGSSTLLKKVTLDNGVEVVASGNLTKSGTSVYFKGENLDLSKVVTKVVWGNVDVSGANLRALHPGDINDEWGRVYNYRQGGANKFYVGKTRTWYRIPNAATTADGVVHDVYAMFDIDARGLHPYYQSAGEVAFWNADGSINAVDGTSTSGTNGGDGIRTVLSLDRPNNDDKNIIWSTLISDIDGGQYLENVGKILGVGGGLTTNSVQINRPASDHQLGYAYGINHNENALNGSQSSPDGTVLVVDTGMYTNVVRNTAGSRSTLVARADFGSDSDVVRTFIRRIRKTTVAPPIELKALATYIPESNEYIPHTYDPVPFVPKDASYKPVTYTPVTYTPKDSSYKPVGYTPVTYTPKDPSYTKVGYEPVSYTPKDSSYKPVGYTPVPFIPTPYSPNEIPEVPEDPTLKLVTVTKPTEPKHRELPKKPVSPTVRYHLTALNENTPVEKAVTNEDGVDVDNQSVAKGSVNHFILRPKDLPAGRPETASIVNSDYIADGLEVDVEATTKANETWDIAYDTNSRLLEVKANKLELAKANGNLAKSYTPTAFTLIFKTLNDSAKYENVFKMNVKGTEGSEYVSYSNKVRIHTPGGPDNPNDKENKSGKGYHKIQPTKNNTDVKGNNINDKTLLQSDTNYYVAEWDLDQYIKDKSSKSAIAKGFGYIDNYDETAVEPLKEKYTVVDAKGNKVEGLKLYEADASKLEELPEALQQFVKDSGIDVSKFGKFHIWLAEDSQAFYDKYVKTGTDVFFNLPMVVKKGYTGKYTNQTYQIDFGNGYYGNVVRNDVPDFTPKKDVVVDGKSADGGEVVYGQEFKYLLSGSKLPGNRGSHLWEYRYIDDYDQTGDKFLGTYKVVATTDITVVNVITVESDTVADKDVTLEDGKVVKKGETIKAGSKIKSEELIKAGTDLTKYTTMEHDDTNGIVTIAFKEEFLKSIKDSSEFGADASIDMKRISYGTFENKYTNRINGVDYISNTVRTTTPKPKDPEEPEVCPLPQPKRKVLPKTGESGSAGLAFMGGVVSILSLGLLGRRRKED